MNDTTQVTTIPKADWNGRGADMRSRLVTWRWHWSLAAGMRELELDFSKVNFMEPWALAMFAAYGLGMRERGVATRARLDESNAANVYLRDMGIGELLATGAAAGATRTAHLLLLEAGSSPAAVARTVSISRPVVVVV